jgi:hypothetical protein
VPFVPATRAFGARLALRRVPFRSILGETGPGGRVVSWITFERYEKSRHQLPPSASLPVTAPARATSPEDPVPGTPAPLGPVDWLASAAPDPRACRREWERHPLGVTLLPAGRLWDVLVVTGPLGRPALDLLHHLDPGGPGPVLADFHDTRTGFFVPPGTATRWLGTGVRAAGTGSWITVPYPGRPSGAVRWLVPPDGSGHLNDPALLETALHEAAARHAGP